MNRNTKVYIGDILESLRAIEQYIANSTTKDFLGDQKTQDAVARRLEIMGEAVKQVPQEVRELQPDIPWQKIAGLRDVLIHQYHGVAAQRVWGIIKDDLPPLRQKMQQLFETLPD